MLNYSKVRKISSGRTQDTPQEWQHIVQVKNGEGIENYTKDGLNAKAGHYTLALIVVSERSIPVVTFLKYVK